MTASPVPVPVPVSRPEGPILLFDGDCVLCDRSVRFIAARDTDAAFRFAALESPAGQRLLAAHGLADDRPDSVVLIEDGRAYLRSDAVLRAAARLGRPWRWGRGFLIVPRPLRDAAYRLVARLRYRLFGRRGAEACGLPPRGLADRIVPEGLGPVAR
jgi:predicted DCC family thiol-disulfide oxidoreductase YuxK